MDSVIQQIRNELLILSDERNRISGQNFFKEKVLIHGVKTADVSKIAKEHFKSLGKIPKNEIFNLCNELWQSGYLEESFIACNWSYSVHKKYEPEDFGLFDNWVETYVTNWASCDTLCNHTIGEFIEMYPSYLSELKKWTFSKNRWKRRAAAVSLIIPARKGKFLSEIIEIADIMLMDKDDMVQKGYGWMLKVASQAHREDVFSYVMAKKDVMPRTALRYAIEKMPPEYRKRAMAK